MSTPVFPRYSFVQLENSTATAAHCTPDPGFCLPMSDPANVAFHVKFPDIDNYDGNLLYMLNYAIPVPCSSTTITTAMTSSTPLLFGNHYYSTGTDDYRYVDYHVHFDLPVATLDECGVAPGDCFKLLLIYYLVVTDPFHDNAETTLGPFGGTYTNCFMRSTGADTCYSSVIKYWNNSDAFDFDYAWGHTFASKVELPMYLRDPKMENEQKVYTRSDGFLVKLYERKEETYMLETDLMPYTWHKNLDIALSHDTVTISNANASSFDPLNTATQFVKKENYEIEYNKSPLSSLGKGMCKLSNAQAIHLINNNCG